MDKQHENYHRKEDDVEETMTLGQDAPFSPENWKGVLEALRFQVQENPNGVFTVYDNDSFPLLQYTTEEEKERVYYFLAGMEVQRMFDLIPKWLEKSIGRPHRKLKKGESGWIK